MVLPLLAVLVFAPAAEGSAPPPAESEAPDVDALEAEAQAAFDAGDYDRVVEVAKRGYEASGKLAFLYAQAHAERYRGNCRDAMGLYGRVIAADPEGPFAAFARDGIQACEARDPEPEVAPEPEPEPAPPPIPVEPAPAEPTRDRKRSDPVGIALVSLGAASAVASVALFVTGGLALDQAEDADDEAVFDDSRIRARRLFIGGGVAAGAAVALTTVGAIRLARHRREHVALHLTPEFVGLSLRARF